MLINSKSYAQEKQDNLPSIKKFSIAVKELSFILLPFCKILWELQIKKLLILFLAGIHVATRNYFSMAPTPAGAKEFSGTLEGTLALLN